MHASDLALLVLLGLLAYIAPLLQERHLLLVEAVRLAGLGTEFVGHFDVAAIFA